MKKPNEAFQVANLALGPQQDILNSLQKLPDFRLRQVKTPGTKIYTPTYVLYLNPKLNFLPANRIAKNLAEA